MEDDYLSAGSRTPANGRLAQPDSPLSRCCRRRLLRWGQWAVNLAALAVAVLVFTPAGDWLGDGLVRADGLEKADFIVVLGGAPERAVEAARLYRQGWAPKVVLSSTAGGTDYLADIAKSYGVPESVMVLDRQARRTADHPATVAAAAGLQPHQARLIVVTSSYHTSRARAVFRKAGYGHVLMRPPGWSLGGDFAEPGGSATRWPKLPAVLHELGAWAYYGLRGWL